MGRRRYRVRYGDSWESIAGRVYGDQRMFWHLANANRHLFNKSKGTWAILQPGMTINIPPKRRSPYVPESAWERLYPGHPEWWPEEKRPSEEFRFDPEAIQEYLRQRREWEERGKEVGKEIVKSVRPLQREWWGRAQMGLMDLMKGREIGYTSWTPETIDVDGQELQIEDVTEEDLRDHINSEKTVIEHKKLTGQSLSDQDRWVLETDRLIKEYDENQSAAADIMALYLGTGKPQAGGFTSYEQDERAKEIKEEYGGEIPVTREGGKTVWVPGVGGQPIPVKLADAGTATKQKIFGVLGDYAAGTVGTAFETSGLDPWTEFLWHTGEFGMNFPKAVYYSITDDAQEHKMPVFSHYYDEYLKTGNRDYVVKIPNSQLSAQSAIDNVRWVPKVDFFSARAVAAYDHVRGAGDAIGHQLESDYEPPEDVIHYKGSPTQDLLVDAFFVGLSVPGGGAVIHRPIQSGDEEWYEKRQEIITDLRREARDEREIAYLELDEADVSMQKYYETGDEGWLTAAQIQYRKAEESVARAIELDMRTPEIMNPQWDLTWEFEPSRQKEFIHALAIAEIQLRRPLKEWEIREIRDHFTNPGLSALGQTVYDPIFWLSLCGAPDVSDVLIQGIKWGGGKVFGYGIKAIANMPKFFSLIDEAVQIGFKLEDVPLVKFLPKEAQERAMRLFVDVPPGQLVDNLKNSKVVRFYDDVTERAGKYLDSRFDALYPGAGAAKEWGESFLKTLDDWGVPVSKKNAGKLLSWLPRTLSRFGPFKFAADITDSLVNRATRAQADRVARQGRNFLFYIAKASDDFDGFAATVKNFVDAYTQVSGESSFKKLLAEVWAMSDLPEGMSGKHIQGFLELLMIGDPKAKKLALKNLDPERFMRSLENIYSGLINEDAAKFLNKWQRAVDNPTGRLAKKFTRQFNRRPTQSLLLKTAQEQALRNIGPEQVSMRMFDEFRSGYLAHLTKGTYGYLTDNLLAHFLRALPGDVYEYKTLFDVLGEKGWLDKTKSVTRFFRRFTDAWIMSVLSFRPAWLFRNYLDSSFRVLIHGPDALFDNIFVPMREMMEIAPDAFPKGDLAQSFVSSSLRRSGETIVNLIERGDVKGLSTFFPAWVGFTKEAFIRNFSEVQIEAAAKGKLAYLLSLPKYTLGAFGEGVVDMNSAIEFCLRFRMMWNRFAKDFTPRAVGIAEQELARIGEKGASDQLLNTCRRLLDVAGPNVNRFEAMSMRLAEGYGPAGRKVHALLMADPEVDRLLRGLKPTERQAFLAQSYNAIEQFIEITGKDVTDKQVADFFAQMRHQVETRPYIEDQLKKLEQLRQVPPDYSPDAAKNAPPLSDDFMEEVEELDVELKEAAEEADEILEGAETIVRPEAPTQWVETDDPTTRWMQGTGLDEYVPFVWTEEYQKAGLRVAKENAWINGDDGVYGRLVAMLDEAETPEQVKQIRAKIVELSNLGQDIDKAHSMMQSYAAELFPNFTYPWGDKKRAWSSYRIMHINYYDRVSRSLASVREAVVRGVNPLDIDLSLPSYREIFESGGYTFAVTEGKLENIYWLDPQKLMNKGQPIGVNTKAGIRRFLDSVFGKGTPNEGIDELLEKPFRAAGEVEKVPENVVKVYSDIEDPILDDYWDTSMEWLGWDTKFSRHVETPDHLREYFLDRIAIAKEREQKQLIRFYEEKLEHLGKIEDQMQQVRLGVADHPEVLGRPPKFPVTRPRYKMYDHWQTGLAMQEDLIHKQETYLNVLEVLEERMKEGLDRDDLYLLGIPEQERALFDEFRSSASKRLGEAVNFSLYGDEAYEGALPYTQRIMLDYTEYTGFDEMVRSNIWPFWLFTRHSVPMWMETVAQRPWIMGLWARYLRFTNIQKKQAGYTTSRGDVLPSLEGCIRIPGTQVWINPFQSFSVGTILPYFRHRYYRDEEAWADRSIVQQSFSWLYETGNYMGLSMAPWVQWPLESVGVLDPNETFTSPIVPQANLIPKWMVDDLRYKAQQLEYGWLDVAIKRTLGTEVPYEDYLIERRLFGTLAEAMQHDPDKFEEMYDDAVEALGYKLTDEGERALKAMQEGKPYDPQEATGPLFTYSPRENHPLWQEAKRDVQEYDLAFNNIGYFTGFYGKEFTDAEAELLRIRDEINFHKNMINNQAGAIMFHLDPVPENRYDHYIEARYETPEGRLSDLYGYGRWVRLEEGGPAYGMPRRELMLWRIHEGETTEAYWDAVKDAGERRNQRLLRHKIGAHYREKQHIYMQYFRELAFIESNPLYNDARRQSFVGYKPTRLIKTHLEDQFYRMIYTTRPIYDPAIDKDWPTFLKREEYWRTHEVPLIAAEAGIALTAIGYDYLTGGQGLDPATVDQIMTGTFEVPGDRYINLGEIIRDIVSEFSVESFDEWDLSNDSAYSALNNAWRELYWDIYWTTMKDLEGKERDLAEMRFKKEHPTPTDSELIQWVLNNYPEGQFEEADLRQILDQAGISTIDDRLRYSETNLQRIEHEVWEALKLVPPGQLDLVREQLGAMSGGKDEWLDAFFIAGSNWRDEEEFRKFADMVVEAVDWLEFDPPSASALTEWIRAQELNDKFKIIVTSKFGPEFYPIISHYYTLSNREKAAFRKKYEFISEYYDLKDAFAKDNQLWAKYYHEREYEGEDEIRATKSFRDTVGEVAYEEIIALSREENPKPLRPDTVRYLEKLALKHPRFKVTIGMLLQRNDSLTP